MYGNRAHKAKKQIFNRAAVLNIYWKQLYCKSAQGMSVGVSWRQHGGVQRLWN
jgi:hypothetical protein